jgi:hypothetical protein
MNNCFIISFYLPTKESLSVLEDIIIRLKHGFNNPTVIIGFNPSKFVNDGIEIIQKCTNINILYDVVEDYLVCDSDASGFQCALNILKKQNNRFDLYWFLHSKAVTTNRDVEREYMINDFISNRNKIESLFSENDFIGSYGDMMIHLGTLKPGHKFTSPTISGNYLEKFYDFNIKMPLEYFYAKTFYVIKGKILNNFIDGCKLSFFSKPLNIDENITNQTDRYFFERDFIRVVDKMGYIVLGRVVSNDISDNRWGDISVVQSNMDYLDEVQNWLEINDISLNKDNVIKILKEWQRL